jgi:hypothetical protein
VALIASLAVQAWRSPEPWALAFTLTGTFTAVVCLAIACTEKRPFPYRLLAPFALFLFWFLAWMAVMCGDVKPRYYYTFDPKDLEALQGSE